MSTTTASNGTINRVKHLFRKTMKWCAFEELKKQPDLDNKELMRVVRERHGRNLTENYASVLRCEFRAHQQYPPRQTPPPPPPPAPAQSNLEELLSVISKMGVNRAISVLKLIDALK